MRLSASVLAIVLIGCPAKEGEQKDANAPPPSNMNASGGGPVATGPLAALESAPFMNEVWNAQGQQTPILYYTRENVRVNAQCRNPAGQLNCAALSQIRGAPPIPIAKSELTGKPAGVLACVKLGNQLVIAVNQGGNEEQFCRFKDGSLLSTNTLEQYGIKIQ